MRRKILDRKKAASDRIYTATQIWQMDGLVSLMPSNELPENQLVGNSRLQLFIVFHWVIYIDIYAKPAINRKIIQSQYNISSTFNLRNISFNHTVIYSLQKQWTVSIIIQIPIFKNHFNNTDHKSINYLGQGGPTIIYLGSRILSVGPKGKETTPGTIFEN